MEDHADAAAESLSAAALAGVLAWAVIRPREWPEAVAAVTTAVPSLDATVVLFTPVVATPTPATVRDTTHRHPASPARSRARPGEWVPRPAAAGPRAG